jgi:MraZ protein
MALFLSTYVNKMDKKGRVSVPASFRASLSTEESDTPMIVLFRSNTHQCLEGFAFSFMQELSARLDHYDLFSAEQDDLATTLFGDAVPVSIDGDGRIIVPQDLVQFAAIEEQVSFVGLGNKFQLWAPSLYEVRRMAARENVKAEGLTLPRKTVVTL